MRCWLKAAIRLDDDGVRDLRGLGPQAADGCTRKHKGEVTRGQGGFVNAPKPAPFPTLRVLCSQTLGLAALSASHWHQQLPRLQVTRFRRVEFSMTLLPHSGGLQVSSSKLADLPLISIPLPLFYSKPPSYLAWRRTTTSDLGDSSHL